ncbi:DNA-binding IclR family transcriptional regulator [Crossiella equi]|uniref:DNA-binding IclR family transcriptional regulator n=1 Tax=Crossiella equi TaxID=130796 RepID=A0ABS5A760_9PSEU|nr:helix-turn-helix domain-containing protein [Crossiella equi]MBP2472146.1 DNA-binding IclR family transcriptional regulator [Crossiella equi]
MGRGVLEGAFRLLEEIVDFEECGLSKLAARTGLPKATAHRLLEQLVELGVLERRAGRYRLGVTAFRLGTGRSHAEELRAAARRPLRELCQALPGASVVLLMPDQKQAVVVSANRGEAHAVLPLSSGSRFDPGDTWLRLGATEPDRDGFGWRYRSPFGPVITGASASVRALSGEVVGAVSALVFDQRRLPAMLPAVRHAARVASGQLARIQRTTGR